MEWLKSNYEKAILGLAALILLVCSGLVIKDILAFPEQFVGRNSPKPPDNTVKPMPSEALVAASGKLTAPKKWEIHEGSLFVSRPYVLKDGTLIDPMEGTQNLHNPITNRWIIENELDFAASNLKEQDPDNDGFSNLEEFLAQTNPRDRSSIPPYFTKLRLQQFISKPFRLMFTGSPDDGQTFTINTKDAGGRTQFLEKGQMVEGTPYKVVAYEKKTDTKGEIQVDTSQLTLENTEDGRKIVLVANTETNDPTSFAEFAYLYDNSKITVKKDDEFSLPPQTERKYKLIDISQSEAVIQDQKTREQHKIPPVQ